eukprot:scaffold20.g7689.t1
MLNRRWANGVGLASAARTLAAPAVMAPTGILYALVARRTVVLAEYSGVTGNAPMVALSLLEKVPNVDQKASYLSDQMVFHCLVSSGLTYLCMTDEAFGKRVPFLFLQEVAQLFQQCHGSVAQGAVAYEMQDGFSPTLAERARHYSDPRSDIVSRVRGEVGELQTVMIRNIEQVLERGEKIELLVDRTDELGMQTFAFKREARRLRNETWLRNYKLWAVIVVLVLLALYIVAAVLCGPALHC